MQNWLFHTRGFAVWTLKQVVPNVNHYFCMWEVNKKSEVSSTLQAAVADSSTPDVELPWPNIWWLWANGGAMSQKDHVVSCITEVQRDVDVIRKFNCIGKRTWDTHKATVVPDVVLDATADVHMPESARYMTGLARICTASSLPL